LRGEGGAIEPSQRGIDGRDMGHQNAAYARWAIRRRDMQNKPLDFVSR
jgi:hypothetical protein